LEAEIRRNIQRNIYHGNKGFWKPALRAHKQQGVFK